MNDELEESEESEEIDQETIYIDMALPLDEPIETYDPKFFADAICEYFRSGGYRSPVIAALVDTLTLDFYRQTVDNHIANVASNTTKVSYER